MRDTPSPDILVIGYGNDLRGDDGLGPRIAAEVATRGWPAVQALAVHQLTPELAEKLAGVRLAIFADARADQRDEIVQVIRIEPKPDRGRTTHAASPAALLGLTQTLYGRSPAAWLVTVAAEQFEYGEVLSASARQHMGMALAEIEALLRNSDKPPAYTT